MKARFISRRKGTHIYRNLQHFGGNFPAVYKMKEATHDRVPLIINNVSSIKFHTDSQRVINPSYCRDAKFCVSWVSYL